MRLACGKRLTHTRFYLIAQTKNSSERERRSGRYKNKSNTTIVNSSIESDSVARASPGKEAEQQSSEKNNCYQFMLFTAKRIKTGALLNVVPRKASKAVAEFCIGANKTNPTSQLRPSVLEGEERHDEQPEDQQSSAILLSPLVSSETRKRKSEARRETSPLRKAPKTG